jgi:RNA polymerase sigma-70 factor (ECF subfamily)
LSAVAPASLQQVPRPLPAEATRLLYERHSGRIFGYCLSLLGSREEAEDAVQTTFMNAQRGLGRGVVPEFELAWLFKIARNVCYNRSESSSRRRRVEAVHDLDALQDVLATPDRGAAPSVGELTRALGAIPERQRRALLLREFQGMSYEEISGELGVSVAAVETLLFRARRSVAEQLEQTGTTRRRGAAASIAALVRWLFEGSAVPLKLAAVTAVVATTATLAVAPALRNHSPAPAPPAPDIATPRTHAGTAPPAHRAIRDKARGASALTAKADATVPPAAVPPAANLPGTSPPPAQSAGGSAPNASTPAVTVTAPTPVPTVPDVTDVLPVPPPAPEISSPTVDLPQVNLPIDSPQLPNLPALP